MYRRRSRLEIFLSILSVVRGGKDRPTNIAYAVNMSWNRSQRMLSNLVDRDLLEVMIAERARRRYVITEKGVNMINYFEKAQEILPKDAYLTAQYSVSSSRLP